MRFPALLLACSLIPACVDVDDDLPEGEDGVGDYDESTTDDKADATNEIRARIDGLTVWVDPTLHHTSAGWELEGRASRNLESVFSFVPDDAFATAVTTTARGFKVTFAPGSELNTMMSGLPILIQVRPISGESATAAVWFKPRLTAFTGSTRVYLNTTIQPVWIGGELAYRGGASTAAGWGDLAVWGDGGAGPQVIAQPLRKFRIDWTYDALIAAQIVHAAAYKDGATAEKTGQLEVAVGKLALTRQDPYDAWPRTCEPAVQACLDALVGTVDTGACGTYRQVQSCGGVSVAAEPTKAQIQTDLRAHLVGYYATYGADVIAGGGNTLAQAQALVDATKITEVTTPDGDPEAHDLAQFRVYTHPDMIFPGSGIAWFVVYDRATGALVVAYNFD